jgi:hypothetical protein
MQFAITSETLGLVLVGMLYVSAADSVAADPASTQVQHKKSKVHSCCDTGKRSKFQHESSAKPSGRPLIGAQTYTFKTVPNPTNGSSGNSSSPGFRWWYDYSGGK